MKKILLITYYFPPCGGAAVQRWLRLLPLLDKAGFRITVLTTLNGDYPVTDDTLMDKLPSGIEIVRTFTPVFGSIWKKLAGKDKSVPYGSLDNSKSTSALEKLMYWLRLNIIFPDARVVWNRYAKSKALSLCRTNGFDWVITTGPPNSTHLIGLYLKKHIRIKWLTDFRDPWTQLYYIKLNKQNPLIEAINTHYEKKVVQTADLNLIVSNAIAEQLPSGKKFILYNGFNLDDFSGIQYSKADKFRIKFIGQLTEGQDIKTLLGFLSDKIAEQGYQDISLTFVGTRKIELPVLNYDTEFLDFMPHQQALREMVDCELLILIINDYVGNKGMLTTKIFEYIASGTPILCIGPLDGEAVSIIKQAQAGFAADVISQNIWIYFEGLYSKWQTGKPNRCDHDISQWSVQQQVKELISVLP